MDDGRTLNDIITSLKTKNTMDINFLSTKIIQTGSEYISKPLCDIINTCFEQGIIPHQMKIAKVSAIYKKGDPQIPETAQTIVQ